MRQFDTWSLSDNRRNFISSNMKKLSDLCLNSIGINLHSINRAGTFLAPVHKEILLERLGFHDKLTPEYLPHITYNLFAQTLKQINWYKSEQLTDALLKQLGSSGCQLRHITIHACPNVTDAGIMNITHGQEDLQILEIRKLHSLTAKGLQHVYSGALQKVDLRGCASITTDAIEGLVTRNPNISNLILVGCNKLNLQVFSVIATKLKDQLEHLDVAGRYALSDDCLSVLAQHCCNLQSLNIHGCNKITSEGLNQVLQNCTKLKNLDLSYCTTLENEPHSNCLTRLPTSLSELSLCGVMINNSKLLVESITQLKGLKVVRFCGVPAITDESLEEILSVIGSSLELLDLSGGIISPLTDEGLKAIDKYCTKLQSLALSLLKNVTGITLLPWIKDPERATEITTLLLSCRKLDMEFLHQVAISCVNLSKLNVAGIELVGDELLWSLAEHCPHLTYINLKGCKKVTDAGVCELARCLPLTTLVLSGLHNLTDRSIFALANSCPYLEEIYLSGCACITREAIWYLMDQCIPRLYFQHKVPNADPGQLMAHNLDSGEYCRADNM